VRLRGSAEKTGWCVEKGLVVRDVGIADEAATRYMRCTGKGSEVVLRTTAVCAAKESMARGVGDRKHRSGCLRAMASDAERQKVDVGLSEGWCEWCPGVVGRVVYVLCPIREGAGRRWSREERR
jgi:hypothetical protein